MPRTYDELTDYTATERGRPATSLGTMRGSEMVDRWFFVRQIEVEGDSSAPEFEIQLLNRDGQATTAVRFGSGTTDLVLAGEPVPSEVVEAAFERQPGDGAYVDATGTPTPAF